MKHTYLKSKNSNLESEDYVIFKTMTNYTIMMASDGNGSLGARSSIVNIGNNSKGSEVAFTTRKYSIKIVNTIIHYLLTNRTVDIKKLTNMIKNVELDSIELTTGFCFSLALIENNKNICHTWTIGDCGYIITHPNTDTYEESIISTTAIIAERGEPINIVPAIFPDNMQSELVYNKHLMPKNSRIIVYSDGLGWTPQITPEMMAIRPSRNRYYNKNIIDKYVLMSEDLDDNYKHYGNIDKSRLINILKQYSTSSYIVDKIVKESFPLVRIDDFCICVYIHK